MKSYMQSWIPVKDTWLHLCTSQQQIKGLPEDRTSRIDGVEMRLKVKPPCVARTSGLRQHWKASEEFAHEKVLYDKH
jgi:hypothetical protein